MATGPTEVGGVTSDLDAVPISTGHDDAYDFGVAEFVGVVRRSPDTHAELVEDPPARCTEPVPKAPLACPLCPRRRERAPFASVERLQIDDLALRRIGLAAQLAAEDDGSAVPRTLTARLQRRRRRHLEGDAPV